MSQNVIQPALSSGELSTSLFGRVDLERYHSGVALMYNFFVDYKGGASSRAGTEFINEAYDGDNEVRLIRFVFNTSQNYVLEFGHRYIRFIKNGGYIIERSATITGVSQATRAVVTSPSHGLSSGEWIVITGIVGMTELNNKTYIVDSATLNTFLLMDLDGNYVDSSAFTAYVSDGTADQLLRIDSPYNSADLFDLKYTQSADVMTITHPSYAQRDLIRNDEADWELDIVTIGTDISPPSSGLTGTKSSDGKTAYSYKITAVSATGQESIASDQILISQAVNFAANAGNNRLDWDAVTGAIRYNIYKANPVAGFNGTLIDEGALHGYIGSTTRSRFRDSNILPDFTRCPPDHDNPFANNHWPATVSYFQQRKVYGGSNANPETVNLSQPGAFDNFDSSIPVKDDDAIEATLASREINRIKYMVPMPGGLIVFTSGQAFQISGGGANDGVTPANIVATPQAYNGCADIEPIPIDYNILYVQSKGNIVRALAYNFYTNIYSGVDLSIFSSHLFEGFTIKDWCYAEAPAKVLWAARSDGKLLSLTYLAEQKISGWAQHASKGLFQSTCSVQEGTENIVYFVVKRFINGAWRRYIERMHERTFDYGVEDAWCVDAGLRNTPTFPAATLTAAAYTGTNILFTASAAVFTSANATNNWVIRMGGGIIKVKTFVSSKQVRGDILRNIQDVIPEDPDNTPIVAESGDWTITEPITEVSGLDHLEGQTVAALADGNVVTGLVVTDGVVTLPVAATKITIGLRYACKLQTLPLDTGDPTVQGKRKKVSAATIRVSNSRGLKLGNTFDDLKPFKERTYQEMGRPIELISGDQRLVMAPAWTELGQVCVEQQNPLPATVLAFVPEITIGDTGK